MKLTKKALDAINETPIRLKLALALECGERTIFRYITDNNDDLTKAAALRVIREETGLTDSQILEDVTEEATK